MRLLLLPWAMTIASPFGTWLAAAHENNQEERSQSAPPAPDPPSSNNDRRRRHNYLHDPSRSSDGPSPDVAWDDFLRNAREQRRVREPVKVDYMGQHPFERSSQDDHKRNARQAQSVPTTANTNAMSYEPIRVQFDTHLLDELSADYPTHVSYVRDVLLPAQRSFWAGALATVPASEIEVSLSGPTSRCAQEIKMLTGYDLDASLPQNDDSIEVASGGDGLVYRDTDLVVIVVPVEGTFICPAGVGADAASATLAFATNCQNDQLDRPTVGYTGICFGPLDPENDSKAANTRRFLTMAHELTHVLGMNSFDVPYFYDHATGRPRTPRDRWNRPPVGQDVPCVDGTVKNDLPIASEDTLKRVTTANGEIAYEVVTETVVNVVRNQFDCQKMVGGRLENQPTGDTDCFGSHWDHRLFNNEFMAAVNTGSIQYITALTLAFLEDSGWYRSNYAVAQNSPFGLGAGCEFIEDQCIQNGEVPEWGKGTFCSSAASIGCTTDKHLIAYCDIAEWNGDLPAAYQYFEDPTVGSTLNQRDFCPAYTTIFLFESGDDTPTLDCTNSSLNGEWLQVEGELFGENSRCIEHASGIRPLCLEVICDKDAGDVLLVVEGESTRCSDAGEIFQLPSGTKVICPRFEQACPDSFCPSNCAGRGICDYSLSPAKCECFDPDEVSPSCVESQLSSTSTALPATSLSANSPSPPTCGPTRVSPSSAAPTVSTSSSDNQSAPPTKSPSDGPSPFHTKHPVSTGPISLQTTDYVSNSPSTLLANDIASASPAVLQPKDPDFDNHTATTGIGSPTDAPVMQPLVLEIEPMSSTSMPSSGSFETGSASSLLFSAGWALWLLI